MTVALVYAQSVLGLLFVMPIQLLVFFVFKKKTKRDYSFQIDDIFDIGMGVCIVLWAVNYQNWSKIDLPIAGA